GDGEQGGDRQAGQGAAPGDAEAGGEQATGGAHGVEQQGSEEGGRHGRGDSQEGVGAHQGFCFCRKPRTIARALLSRCMRRWRSWMAARSSRAGWSPRSSRRWRSISKVSWSSSTRVIILNVRSVTRRYPSATSRTIAYALPPGNPIGEGSYPERRWHASC